jgi:hypothetical protein
MKISSPAVEELRRFLGWLKIEDGLKNPARLLANLRLQTGPEGIQPPREEALWPTVGSSKRAALF